MASLFFSLLSQQEDGRKKHCGDQVKIYLGCLMLCTDAIFKSTTFQRRNIEKLVPSKTERPEKSKMGLKCKNREYPMDSFWSWVTCISGSLGVALALGFSYSFGVLLPVMMKYFKSSTGDIALLASLTMSFAFLFSPVSGYFCHRFNSTKTMIIGGLLCAVSLLTSSFVNMFALLFFTYCFLFGIGSSFIFTSTIVAVPLNFEKHIALATGLISAGQGIGILCFGPFLQFLLDRFSWHLTFRISSGILILTCVLGIFTGSSISSHRNAPPEVRIRKSSDRSGPRVIIRTTPADQPFWRNAFFIIMTMGSSVEFFAQYIPQVHIVRYCEGIGISSHDASSLFIFFGITSSVGRIAAGLLSKFQRVNPTLLCQLAGYGTAITILALPFARTLPWLRTTFFFYGLFDGFFITTSNYTRLNCLSPKKRAVAFGLSAGCTAAFSAAGPPLAGEMADTFSSYSPPFFMAAAVVCFGATIPFFRLCFPSTWGSTEQRLTEQNSFEDNDTLVVEYLTVL